MRSFEQDQDTVPSAVDAVAGFEFGGEYWQLCGASERFMCESMKFRGTILLNDTLLVKYDGLPAGLLIDEKTVAGGVVRPGIWYYVRWNRSHQDTDDRDGDLLSSLLFQARWRRGPRNIHLPGRISLRQDRPVREQFSWHHAPDGYMTREKFLGKVAQNIAHLRRAGPYRATLPPDQSDPLLS